MHRVNRGLLLIFLIFLLAGEATARASALAAVQERGKLFMLCFPHTRSVFARPDLSHGPTRRVGTAEHFIGIDVELIRSFADSLGVELEIRTLETPGYQPLIPALLEGRADLLASSLTITEAREEVVDFSQPYFTLKTLVVARRGSDLAAPEDLAGQTAVTIAGSSHQEHLRALGIPEERIQYVEFTSAYYTAILEEGADYAILDSITAARDLADFPDLEIAFRLPGEEHYGVALPSGSDLLPALDRFLADLESRGELERLIERNLASLSPDEIGPLD